MYAWHYFSSLELAQRTTQKLIIIDVTVELTIMTETAIQLAFNRTCQFGLLLYAIQCRKIRGSAYGNASNTHIKFD